MTSIMLVGMYLVSIVCANVTVAMFGPKVVVVNALVFIALDLTSRDRLHEAWHHDRLVFKMALLILAGSVLSFLVDAAALRIAVASLVAFAVSETADALVYARLARRSWWIKVNGSNLASAALDSAIFPTLAFGAVLPWIILGQFVAKVVGGVLWSVVLRPRRKAVLSYGD
jgi:queuosine precursor transporter